jgi:hypothetical protein
MSVMDVVGQHLGSPAVRRTGKMPAMPPVLAAGAPAPDARKNVRRVPRAMHFSSQVVLLCAANGVGEV